MIDIGTNFHSRQLRDQTSPILAHARDAGLTAILATGTSLAVSKEALALARAHPAFVYATAGVHPHSASQWSEYVASEMALLWANPEVVAVGECGLDYNRMFSSKEDQRVAFEAQLAAAIHWKKPLFLHNRDAFNDFRALTQEAARAGAKGVVHCFTGSAEEALAHLEDGFDIGITGWVADPHRGHALRQALHVIPLERMHLETDAPYLTPRNMPKAPRVNKPANLPWVARAIAVVLGQDWQSVLRQTETNSRRMFGLS